MQAVIYTRISKDREGGGLGVERQRQDCQELANSLGWDVAEVFSDNDISAHSGKARPGYNAMLQALESGRAQGIIAWHTDRLHRRPIELESFIEVCDRKGVEVRTVQAGVMDMSTASGQLVARMLAAAARHEVDHMIERQKRAKQQAAVDGKFRGGRRAFGYEQTGLTVRAQEADAIRSAAEDVLSGVSLSQVARDWNAKGLRTSFGGNEFTSDEVRKILLRERNAGIVLHDGNRIGTGQWETIVDIDTFTALEALLRDTSRRTSPGYERRYQGSSVYKCGRCGAHMYTSGHNKRRGQWTRTYVCSRTKHLGRDVEHLDDYVDRLVLGRLSQPDAAIVLGAPVDVDLGALQAKREGLRARLDDLSAMFADGEIDGPQLKRGTAELQKNMAMIDAELATARASSAVANLVLAGDDLQATWEGTSPDVRGKIIDSLMTVTVLPAVRGRKPGGTYFDPSSVQIDWKA